MTDLIFDEAKHEYRYKGQVVPGVNEILTKAGIKDEYTGDPYFTELGKATHLAIKLYLEGRLDEEALDPEIVPRLEAFKRLEKDYGLEPICVEVPFMCDANDMLFAGTPDWYMYSQKLEADVLFDGKTGNVDSFKVDCQLSGYETLLTANGHYPDSRASARLMADGHYELVFYDFDAGRLWDMVWTRYERKGWRAHVIKSNGGRAALGTLARDIGRGEPVPEAADSPFGTIGEGIQNPA